MPKKSRTVVSTAVTLVAFASNSILCRLALREGAIDPLAFTAVRLASGALVLAPFLRARAERRWSPLASAALLGYALCFSLAYRSLEAGTGALLLFGAVQVTMIGSGAWRGERLSAPQWLGGAAAMGGLLLFALPGASAPDAGGALLMATAGVAWGTYSLLGRGVRAPAVASACNFALALPFALLALLFARAELVLTLPGVLLAVTSGALTSGLGYVLWYVTLRGHSAASAAIAQLAVPILAAFGGLVLLGEEPSLRLVLAGALTLGGAALAIVAHGDRRA